MSQLLKFIAIVVLFGLTACGRPNPMGPTPDPTEAAITTIPQGADAVIQLGELQKTDGFTYGAEFRETVRVLNCDNPVGRSDTLTEAKAIDRNISWNVVGEVGGNIDVSAIVAGAGVEASIASGYALEVNEELSRGRELELPVNPNSSAEYEIVWKPILWSGFIPFSFQSGEGRIEYIYQQVAFGEVGAFRDRTAEDCLNPGFVATSTPGLVATESVTEPTVVQTPTLPSASPQPSPTTAIGGPPSGPIASDVPGSPLPLGTMATSVIDRNTKPQDVYAVELGAGGTLRVELQADHDVDVDIYMPGPPSLQSGTRVNLCSYDQNCANTYTAAVPGTYYLRVFARDVGTTYSITATGDSGSIPTVASDVPGTPLALGETAISVIDRNVKPQDVYSIELGAGQTLRVQLQADHDTTVDLFMPGPPTVSQGTRVNLCDYDQECINTYRTAVAGTYYLRILARDIGTTYSLSISGDNSTIAPIPNDVPGMSASLGSPLTSVIDRNTKPQDVYAVDLAGGQTLRVELNADREATVDVFMPGPVSLEQGIRVNLCDYDRECINTYTAAIAGTYYLRVYARDVGTTYNLIPTGNDETFPPVAEDIPGTLIESGIAATSVVDRNTKPQDVYSVAMVTGQALRVQLQSDRDVDVDVFLPGAVTIDQGTRVNLCAYDKECTNVYTVAAAGQYFVRVLARDVGTKYTLTVTIQ